MFTQPQQRSKCDTHTSSLTTVNRYGPRRCPRVRYLLSGDDVHTPAVPSRPRALLREKIPVGVTLRDECSDSVGAVLPHVLAEASLPGEAGVDGDGLAQVQEGAECEIHTQLLHGDDDDDEEGVWLVKTQKHKSQKLCDT